MVHTENSSVAISADRRVRATQTSTWTNTTATVLDTFKMDSTSNRGWQAGLSGDTGNAWFMERTTTQVSPCNVNSITAVGQFWPIAVQGGDPIVSLSSAALSDSTLDSLGTTAIARSEPTNPTAELATFVGELREGLPRASIAALKDSRILRNSGDDYLNAQFGWLPMVRDLRKFAMAVKDHNKIIDQYRKGSNQKIRRSYLYPPKSETAIKTGNIILASTPSMLWGGNAMKRVSTSSWFSGAFRYHVPISTNQLEKLNEYEALANKLLGTRITPEVVWNLAPWSWAVDWFGTTGDVLHNISALGNDGLVMQYGYMMSQSKDEFFMNANAATFRNSPVGPSTYYRVVERKQRRRATPYGFGFNMHSLSTKQTAILVALGLSRVG